MNTYGIFRTKCKQLYSIQQLELIEICFIKKIVKIMNLIYRARGFISWHSAGKFIVAVRSRGRQLVEKTSSTHFFIFRNPYISIAFININKQLYIDYIYNIDLDVFISNNNFGLKRNFPCITYKQIKQD